MSTPRIVSRRPVRLLALWLLLQPLTGHADVQAFWTAVEHAQARNPQVHKAEADLRVALESDPQSRAKLMPAASLEAKKSLWGETRYRNTGTESSDNSQSLGVIVNQPLLNAANWLGVEQSKSHITAAAADMEGTRQEVTLAVAMAAAEWLQAREVLKLAEDYRQVTARHLHVNRLRLKAGESTETDVEEAASRAAQAEASHSTAQNTLDQSLAYFRQVVGDTPDAKLTLPQLPLPYGGGVAPRELMAELERLVEERADVQAAMARIRESEKGEEMRRAEHLPTVDLTYEGSRTWDRELGGTTGISRLDDVDEHSVMVTLTLPLFNGGDTVSRTREAKALKEGILAELDRVRNQAMREALDAHHDLINSQGAITSLEKALRASTNALNGMEEEFLVGTRTLLDLLDAQFEVFTVQTSLVRQRYQEQLARVRLWKAVGRSLLPETLSAWKPEPREAKVANADPLRELKLPEVWHAEWERYGDAAPVAVAPVKAAPVVEKPAPVVAAPAPVVEAPVKAAPVVEKPAPVVAAPAPVVEAPVKVAPVVEKPAPVAPPVAPPVAGQGVPTATTIPGFPATAWGPYYVRIGSYTSEKAMAEVEGDLAKWKVTTRRESFQPPEGKEVVRVLVGPFANFDTTMRARDLIRQHTGIAAGWVRNREWTGAWETPVVSTPTPVAAMAATTPAAKPTAPVEVTTATGKRTRLLETPEALPVVVKPPVRSATVLGEDKETREGYPPIAHGPFLVHAGTFAKEADSVAARQKLMAEKIPYWLEMSHAPDGTPMIRLLSGPFGDLNHALLAERLIRERTRLTTGWIPNPGWKGHIPEHVDKQP